MRVLIVKLSSLGDVVHALPVVADIRAAHPGALIDWVVEPAFAPLLDRTTGVAKVIDCALRRWTRAGLWRPSTLAEVRAFAARLRRERYDAIVDLQGLTKSAVIARLARGTSFGLANRTDGASHEPSARWLVSKAISVEPHSHALDRSRELVAAALGTRIDTPPSFGLVPRASPEAGRSRTIVLIHGTSRADKLWPEASWIELGRRLADEGWAVALPQAGSEEGRRARAIAAAIGGDSTVWPALELGAFIDRLAPAAPLHPQEVQRCDQVQQQRIGSARETAAGGAAHVGFAAGRAAATRAALCTPFHAAHTAATVGTGSPSTATCRPPLWRACGPVRHEVGKL